MCGWCLLEGSRQPMPSMQHPDRRRTVLEPQRLEAIERPLCSRPTAFFGILRVEVTSRDSPLAGHYWRPSSGENRQHEQRFNNSFDYEPFKPYHKTTASPRAGPISHHPSDRVRTCPDRYHRDKRPRKMVSVLGSELQSGGRHPATGRLPRFAADQLHYSNDPRNQPGTGGETWLSIQYHDGYSYTSPSSG